jgi:hypothetical protein
MNGDTISPETLCIHGSFYYIGVISPAGVPKRRKFVDVYG